MTQLLPEPEITYDAAAVVEDCVEQAMKPFGLPESLIDKLWDDCKDQEDAHVIYLYRIHSLVAAQSMDDTRALAMARSYTEIMRDMGELADVLKLCIAKASLATDGNLDLTAELKKLHAHEMSYGSS